MTSEVFRGSILMSVIFFKMHQKEDGERDRERDGKMDR